MSKVGRNDPCPCGSGKKYKNCHQRIEHQDSKNKGLLVAVLLIVFVAVGAIGVYLNWQSGGPRGEAPPGKVWSEEHQHWHDLPNAGASAPRAASPTGTSQPPGEVPPGKVWSEEHQHWHDK